MKSEAQCRQNPACFKNMLTGKNYVHISYFIPDYFYVHGSLVRDMPFLPPHPHLLMVLYSMCCIQSKPFTKYFCNFYQGSLNVYRFCDNVWTFVLNNVEFRDLPDTVTVDKVKMVACDGRGISLLLHLFSFIH